MGSKRQRQRRDPQSAAASKTAPGESFPARLAAFLERHSRTLAIAAVLLATIRIVATYHVFDHTSDEPAHLACGMEYLDKGVYTWEPQHPPLARVAVALGPYLIGDRSQNTPRKDYVAEFREGAKILYHNDKYDLALALSRAGVLPFFWLACWVVYAWGARYFTPAVAGLAVFFFSFLPPVLAHSGLATTDIAFTSFIAAAFLAACVWIEAPTLAHAAWFGLATGLMVLSKFTGLIFFPASTALALVWYYRRNRPKLPLLSDALRKRIPTFGLAVGIGFVVIWAGYRFSFGHAPDISFPVPFPELFAGLKQLKEHNASGHLGYLLGSVSGFGFWDFFLVALGVKTPLGFLALLAIGIALACRKNSPSDRLWLPLTFSAAILIVTMFSHINIGVRHVLPVYVAFSIVAAFATLHLLKAGAGKAASIAAIVLCGWFAVSSVLSHPDYLAYFNEIAGSQPENILVDSDLDWGQDQKRLAQRLKELGVKEVFYTPHIMADIYREGFPKTYYVNPSMPGPGWNAVSVTQWKEQRMAPWVNRMPPPERVGKSILLWNVNTRGLPQPIPREVHEPELERPAAPR